VWAEVLGFVKRDQLATISLTNRQILEECWPRLHGNRVMAHAHDVDKMVITAARRYPRPFSWFWSPTGILRIDEKEVPFANCPPPDYITGFSTIEFQ
jgi:hypothetical protein